LEIFEKSAKFEIRSGSHSAIKKDIDLIFYMRGAYIF
jgi:hypothetical protein